MRRSLLAFTCVLALTDGFPKGVQAAEGAPVEQKSPIYNSEAVIRPASNTTERQKFVMSRSFLYYHGSISNETLHQVGQLSVVIGMQKQPNLIIVRVHASDGLLGDGELSGALSQGGRFSASGQLLMGSNPFTCDLTGLIKGSELTGSAKFVHNANGNTAYGTFNLTKF